MKHLKMLGVAAMAAAALMAFAGPASANPVLTSPEGTEVTGELEATASGSLLLKASVFNETCASSTVKGNVTINNTGTAAGAISTLTFGNCGSATIHVLQNGSLEVDAEGKVKGSGTQVTVETIGVSCVYGTKTGTTLGTLTGGNPIVIHVKASLPRFSGSFLCADPASWEGQYIVTNSESLPGPVLTSPSGTEYTGTMEATASGSLLLKASIFNETCTQSEVAGEVTTNSTAVASGPINTLTFGNCGTATIHVLQKGSLEVLPSGSVRGSGAQVTVQTIGVSCVYGTTTQTILGTLTGGTPAKITINARLPRISGSFLCADPASWEGQYTVTNPGTLLVDYSPPATPISLTSPAGTEFTGEIHAGASSTLSLKAGFGEIKCTGSSVKGKVESHTATTAAGKISTLAFNGCGSATVDILANGSLKVVSNGNGTGTLQGSGTQVTVFDAGTDCVYGTTINTTLGTLVGSSTAVVNIKASLPRIAGSFLCANPATWEGQYTVRNPAALLID